MIFVKNFLASISKICKLFDNNQIDYLVTELGKIKKKKGRLFF